MTFKTRDHLLVYQAVLIFWGSAFVKHGLLPRPSGSMELLSHGEITNGETDDHEIHVSVGIYSDLLTSVGQREENRKPHKYLCFKTKRTLLSYVIKFFHFDYMKEK